MKNRPYPFTAPSSPPSLPPSLSLSQLLPSPSLPHTLPIFPYHSFPKLLFSVFLYSSYNSPFSFSYSTVPPLHHLFSSTFSKICLLYSLHIISTSSSPPSPSFHPPRPRPPLLSPPLLQRFSLPPPASHALPPSFLPRRYTEQGASYIPRQTSLMQPSPGDKMGRISEQCGKCRLIMQMDQGINL